MALTYVAVVGAPAPELVIIRRVGGAVAPAPTHAGTIGHIRPTSACVVGSPAASIADSPLLLAIHARTTMSFPAITFPSITRCVRQQFGRLFSWRKR